MTAIPNPVVDALPERLWYYGNLYQVFGRTVHFCVDDESCRTIELDGDEIGRGRPIGDVPDGPTNPHVATWLHELDIGWLVSAGLVLAILVVLRPGRARGR